MAPIYGYLLSPASTISLIRRWTVCTEKYKSDVYTKDQGTYAFRMFNAVMKRKDNNCGGGLSDQEEAAIASNLRSLLHE